MDEEVALGWPGIEPRWTSSAKSGVGTSASSASRVWFTLSHGIVNEVYYPGVDTANTRDLGFVVTGPEGYFSEEKRDCDSVVELIAPGVPGYHLVNSARDGQYRIEKTVITHPHVSALLQRVRFSRGASDQRLFALLAPHIRNRGRGNDGWVGDYKGVPVLFARRGSVSLALACSSPFLARSVGYAGTSDGWQDLSAHGELAWRYNKAPDGNIALTSEIDLRPDGREFVLAVGFGSTPAEAAQVARLSACTAVRASPRTLRPGMARRRERPSSLPRNHRSEGTAGSHQSRRPPLARVEDIARRVRCQSLDPVGK